MMIFLMIYHSVYLIFGFVKVFLKGGFAGKTEVEKNNIYNMMDEESTAGPCCFHVALFAFRFGQTPGEDDKSAEPARER